MKVEDLDPILSKTDLSSLSMNVQPEAMAFAIAQLTWLVETSSIDHRWTSKTFDSGGLAITAIVAARRCYARVGDLAPIVEAVTKFFAYVDDPHEDVAFAREIISSAKSVDDAGHDAWSTRLYEMRADDETPASARCLLEVAHLTLDLYASDPYCHTYSNEERNLAHAAFEIAAELAINVSESAAREFIASLDALGVA